MRARRRFLKAAALLGASACSGLGVSAAGAQQSAPSSATRRPIRILMGGYAPPATSFSLALKRIGERLAAELGDEVDVKYVHNILDLGYKSLDILWLVEDGLLALGYQSSSYMTDQVPDLGLIDLPFLFADDASARAAMDGPLGEILAARIEARMNVRVLGYLENGFRHISNRVRPVRTPADLAGLTIRVLPSRVHARTFELLGAKPEMLDLTEAIERIETGALDAQENPFANTVTYGVHAFHRYHTMTKHFYLSRPIFVHRPSFDAWPRALQEQIRAAVADAVLFQRALKEKEEQEAAAVIRQAGGEIVELTSEQLDAFVERVHPLYAEALARYDRELLGLVDLQR
jgi:TRAP-type C4-dicarboxylate transport system substrate-binding protein